MSRAVLVISLEEEGPQRLVMAMEQVRDAIKTMPEVKVYMAIKETADQILEIFKDMD